MNDDQSTDTSAISGARRDFVANELRRENLAADPIDQFDSWLQSARDARLIDATAMALSTVDKDGRPHSRIVLLKKVDRSGFTFYTNYHSNKGNELAGNNYAALLFYWRELERQVRIEGKVAQLPAENADDYFYSRPSGSRFSAAASAQSKPVANRQVLEHAVQQLRSQHTDDNVPRPQNWGGYCLTPSRLEFWQGRADRLHDRFCYLWQSEEEDKSGWALQRLSP